MEWKNGVLHRIGCGCLVGALLCIATVQPENLNLAAGNVDFSDVVGLYMGAVSGSTGTGGTILIAGNDGVVRSVFDFDAHHAQVAIEEENQT